MEQQVIIIGGGPCGLVAAHALIARGLQVGVYETQPTTSAAGAGIVLAINAMRMLASIGLDRRLRPIGCSLKQGRVEDGQGSVLQAMAMSDLHERYGQENLAIGRVPLAQALAAALPSDTLHYGQCLARVSQEGDGIWAEFESGLRVRGNVLIGCDGIHSRVRAHAWGLVDLLYSGYTCWRGIVPVSHPDGHGVFVERWHRGTRFGTVPISDEATYWFATAKVEPGGRDGDDVVDAIARRFAPMTGSVPQMLAAIAEQGPDGILRRDVHDFSPLNRWSSGRVTLAGDAAHAMTPNLGQGACQAIEDGVVLAAHLAEVDLRDLAALGRALAAYEGERRARANAIVRRARNFGRLASLESGWSQGVRDFVLRRFRAPRWTERAMRDLYGVAVPGAPRMTGGS